MRKKRVWQGTSAASSSKRSSAAGSRSMHTSSPVGPIRFATRRAWPPAPKVQSTATSPGCGSSASISSPARTGTCGRVMSRRMVKVPCDVGHFAGQVALLLLPLLARPQLEPVVGADQDDVLLDPRVREEDGGQRHAAAGVEVHVEGAPGEEARQLLVLGAHRVQLGQELVAEGVEARWREDRDACCVVRLHEDQPVREGRPELCRHVQPVLRIQRLVEMPAKLHSSPGRGFWDRGGGVGGAPPPRSGSTEGHSNPLCPTYQHLDPHSSRMWTSVRSPHTSIPLYERDSGGGRRWETGPNLALYCNADCAPSARALTKAAATSSITEGTSSSATTSCIFGPARAACSWIALLRASLTSRAWAVSVSASGAPCRTARASAPAKVSTSGMSSSLRCASSASASGTPTDT